MVETPVELFKATAVREKMNALRSEDSVTRSLSDHLTMLGFQPRKTNDAFFGGKQSYQVSVRKTASATVYVQDYKKRDSTDLAALISIELTVGKRSETRTFGVILPKGNLKKAVGFESPDGNSVIYLSRSFWSCVWSRWQDSCGPGCAQSAATSGLRSGFISCGGCAIRAAACCVCECRSWCSWAAGCCE